MKVFLTYMSSSECKEALSIISILHRMSFYSTFIFVNRYNIGVACRFVSGYLHDFSYIIISSYTLRSREVCDDRIVCDNVNPVEIMVRVKTVHDSAQQRT